MKLCGFSVFGRTMPLLEGGPLHVDVGFVRQVDVTGSSENSPRLIDTLRLQVLSVLNTHTHTQCYYTHMLCLNVNHTHKHADPTLVQNSSYRAQAIRQRSKRMRTPWSSRATTTSADPSWGWAVTSDSSVTAWFGSSRRQ